MYVQTLTVAVRPYESMRVYEYICYPSLLFNSSGPDNFWLLLLGQTVASGTNLLVWGTPSYVAGIWFPASQRGIAAAAVGALSAQVRIIMCVCVCVCVCVSNLIRVQFQHPILTPQYLSIMMQD